MHYYVNRLQVPDRNMYPSYKSQEDLKDDSMMYWIAMNCLILIISSFYILFYARVYESFGLFVRICQQTIASMSNFVVFLFFWMVIFLYLFLIVTGSQINDDYKFKEGEGKNEKEFSLVDYWTTSMIDTYRNTIGDLQIPNIDFWKARFKKYDTSFHKLDVLVIYYIWFLWIMQTMGLMIMMLNLLVSILGTVYEGAQDNILTFQYQFRCSMISEAAAIKEFVGCCKK